MYPDWPETVADLVPLPLCPGPKLAAFDFKGPQDIEFLDYLGEGLHAHVIKVKIMGQKYALKLVRFYNNRIPGARVPGSSGISGSYTLTLLALSSSVLYTKKTGQALESTRLIVRAPN